MRSLEARLQRQRSSRQQLETHIKDLYADYTTLQQMNGGLEVRFLCCTAKAGDLRTMVNPRMKRQQINNCTVALRHNLKVLVEHGRVPKHGYTVVHYELVHCVGVEYPVSCMC